MLRPSDFLGSSCPVAGSGSAALTFCCHQPVITTQDEGPLSVKVARVNHDATPKTKIAIAVPQKRKPSPLRALLVA
jgi:hypothetical protein